MSQGNNIETKVQNLLEPVIKNLNYSLYDVQYLKEGKDFYLRITIDKPEGISIQDCEKVNDAINDILDEANFIKDGYFLEVSSPGLERNLRKPEHFEAQIGNKIKIKLFKTIDKKKEFEGILLKYTENELELEIESEKLSFENSNIATCKTVVDIF